MIKKINFFKIFIVFLLLYLFLISCKEKNITNPEDEQKIFNVKWSYTSENLISASLAIDNNGNIIVPSYNDSLISIDQNGNINWKNSSSISEASINSNGTIISSKENHILGLDSNGNILWDSYTFYNPKTSFAIDLNNNIFCGFGYLDSFVSYDINGNPKWSFLSDGSTYSNSAVDIVGNIYFGSRGGSFYSLNSQGNLRWKFIVDSTGIDYFTSPAIDTDGIIYFGCKKNTTSFFYALFSDGSMKWKFSKEYLYSCNNPIIGINNIYLPIRNVLYKFDKDGNVIWTFEADRHISTPVLGNNGAIYFIEFTGTFYSIDINGNLIWKYNIEDFGADYGFNPAIDSNGNIYINGYYKIVAFSDTSCTSLAKTPWPMYLHDAQHTSRQGL